MTATIAIHLTDLIAAEKFGENLQDKYRSRVQEARRAAGSDLIDLIFISGDAPYVHAVLVQAAITAVDALMKEPLPEEP